MHVFRFVSTLCNTLGEYLDVITYCAKIKVLNVNRDRWEFWRNCMWMITILYAVADQIAITRQTLAHRNRLLQQKKMLEYSEVTISTTKYTDKYTTPSSATTIREKKEQLNADIAEVHDKLTNIVYNYTRYSCDFVMCSANLTGREHKGVFGLLGVLSGVLGLKQTWQRL
jgi:hypothetical protein